MRNMSDVTWPERYPGNWIADAQEATGGICPDPEHHNLHTDGRWMYENCPACGGADNLLNCTLCGKLADSALIPWGSERICLNCADEQIDLMATAILIEAAEAAGKVA